MAAFKISRTSRREPWLCVTDPPRRSDRAARGERDSHSAGWMSTACALRRVFSSFGLNSLGRSAESDERHPACQNPPGGQGFSVPPLVLFSRRDSSPRRPGRWLNQQLGHQLVLAALRLFLGFFGVGSRNGSLVFVTPIGSSSFRAVKSRFLYSHLRPVDPWCKVGRCREKERRAAGWVALNNSAPFADNTATNSNNNRNRLRLGSSIWWRC